MDLEAQRNELVIYFDLAMESGVLGLAEKKTVTIFSTVIMSDLQVEIECVSVITIRLHGTLIRRSPHQLPS